MPKIQLSFKQVLEYIILGAKNENYQAVVDIAQDCIDEINKQEETAAAQQTEPK